MEQRATSELLRRGKGALTVGYAQEVIGRGRRHTRKRRIGYERGVRRREFEERRTW